MDWAHKITVAQLRRLLTELRDDDVLIPNQVANLTVIRYGRYVGYVDLLDPVQHVEILEKDT